MNIDEVIADAKAQESVERENIMDRVNKAFEQKRSDTVTISLEEYLVLRQKAIDFDRILQAITDSLELGYHKDELRITGDELVETFRALFGQLYTEIMHELQELDASGE